MSESARVTAIGALAEFKAAFAAFKDDGMDALLAADMEARRATEWLDQQTKQWKREVRDCEDDLAAAKNELARKKMIHYFDKPPDTTEEEKAVRRAQRRLEEAEDKVEACRRWGPALQRAIEEYEGPTRRLCGYLEGSVPRAMALLERMVAALDAYVAMAPPAGSTARQTPQPRKPAEGTPS